MASPITNLYFTLVLAIFTLLASLGLQSNRPAAGDRDNSVWRQRDSRAEEAGHASAKENGDNQSNVNALFGLVVYADSSARLRPTLPQLAALKTNGIMPCARASTARGQGLPADLYLRHSRQIVFCTLQT